MLALMNSRSTKTNKDWFEPKGIYPENQQDFDIKVVRRLIADGKLAPFYQGSLSEGSSVSLELNQAHFFSVTGNNTSFEDIKKGTHKKIKNKNNTQKKISAGKNNVGCNSGRGIREILLKFAGRFFRFVRSRIGRKQEVIINIGKRQARTIGSRNHNERVGKKRVSANRCHSVEEGLCNQSHSSNSLAIPGGNNTEKNVDNSDFHGKVLENSQDYDICTHHQRKGGGDSEKNGGWEQGPHYNDGGNGTERGRDRGYTDLSSHRNTQHQQLSKCGACADTLPVESNNNDCRDSNNSGHRNSDQTSLVLDSHDTDKEKRDVINSKLVGAHASPIQIIQITTNVIKTSSGHNSSEGMEESIKYNTYSSYSILGPPAQVENQKPKIPEKTRPASLSESESVNQHKDEFLKAKECELACSIECPICLMYYKQRLNSTACCAQYICTECFVQLKRTVSKPEPIL
ncbi:Protein SIP5 [Zancudomyces culisetae]|uniref:Protein SIP5 n=1 Tax=Zancudomyces culisetae TaxID=1213189 RepID=A0A1R1PKC5_ZANCU|nr:Protein SIP5 [Zancudomyces culisetae]|eukprot:OMH81373.1 Protein SIP5 [Zancudomyces culisetae]